MTEPSPARFLVVGSGSIGKRHIANLRALHPAASIDCVSASGRLLSADECGADQVHASVTAAIGAAPRFAIVAGAAPSHPGCAAALLAAGIPVLIEKPLADSMASLTPHLEVLRAGAARLDIAYNLRFLPSLRRLRERLLAGDIGRPLAVTAAAGQFLPDWRPAQDYRQGVSARRELGGGVLLELSHELDYLGWLFGPFEQVQARVRRTGSLEIDVEDVVDALLERRDGLVVHLHLDFLQHAPMRQCRIVGESGTLWWDGIADRLVRYTRGGGETVLHEPEAGSRAHTYVDELEHFARVAAGEAAPSTSLAEGIRTLRLVQAVRAASERSAAVAVEEDVE